MVYDFDNNKKFHLLMHLDVTRSLNTYWLSFSVKNSGIGSLDFE